MCVLRLRSFTKKMFKKPDTASAYTMRTKMANLHLSKSRLSLPGLYVALVILAIFCATACATEQEQEQDQASLAPTEVISEWRKTTIVMGANTTDSSLPRPCRAWAVEKEKKSLLKRLKKPKNGDDYTQHHIRYRLLMAIDGFLKYGERAEGGIQRKRDMFGGLSQKQAKVSAFLQVSRQ